MRFSATLSESGRGAGSVVVCPFDSREAFGLTREARIMAESGAIYAVTVILIIATYASSSNSLGASLMARNPP